jgi:hypothetical protein
MAIDFNAQVREGARKLTAQSRLAAAESRYGEAMDSALDAVALGVKMPRGGMIIDLLVGNACVALGSSGTLPLVERLDADELRSARRRVEELLTQTVGEKEVLIQERRVMLQDAHRSGYANPSSRLMYRQLDQVFKEAIKEADKPSSQRQSTPSASSAFGVLLSKTLPDLRKSVDKRDRLLATLHFKLGIEEYRKTHRRLPETVDELVPGIFPQAPLDPVTRKPLRYRRLHTTYEIAPP